METSPAAVLSVGSINLDIQARAERFPAQSETVFGRDFLCTGGGKAANVAWLSVRLGAAARLFGRVGEDAFAELALARLRDSSIDLRGVRRSPGSATGTSMIVVRDDGDKSIVLAANANRAWGDAGAAELAEAVRTAAAGSVLVVDLEIPSEVVHAALRAARERGIVTVLDPSPATYMRDELWPLADYLTPNARELQHLTGIEAHDQAAAERAGKRLVARGVAHACVKLREGGALLVTRDAVQLVRSPQVKVVDETGAGDAFAAALGVALLEQQKPRDAVELAVMAATFAVTRYGSQEAYPTRRELERFIVQARG